MTLPAYLSSSPGIPEGVFVGPRGRRGSPRYDRRMTALLASLALSLAGPWRPVDISFYVSGKTTADGTPMDVNGRWVATRAFPLGSEVEIRYGGKVLRLRVRDRTAKRYGGRADLPKGTWLLFGAPASRGLLRGEWRRVK